MTNPDPKEQLTNELQEFCEEYASVLEGNGQDYMNKWFNRNSDRILDLFTQAQQKLLNDLVEQLPIGEVDLVKFERDKTGWIEEVGVDPDTLTDKDMIAVWQLARHFKQQALTEVTTLINKYREGMK